MRRVMSVTAAMVALTVATGVTSALAGCAPAPLKVEGKATATRGASPAAAPLPTEALANIRNLDLRSTILADDRVPAPLRDILRACTSCGLDDPVYADLTGDGSADVLVPVYDEMIQAGTVAYTVRNDRIELIFAHYGHKATTELLTDGDLLLRVQLFGAGDAACCPSGERTVRYHWTGTRFEQVSVSGDREGLAPIDSDDTVVVGS